MIFFSRLSALDSRYTHSIPAVMITLTRPFLIRSTPIRTECLPIRGEQASTWAELPSSTRSFLPSFLIPAEIHEKKATTKIGDSFSP
jgi:hypothetical protein